MIPTDENKVLDTEYRNGRESGEKKISSDKSKLSIRRSSSSLGRSKMDMKRLNVSKSKQRKYSDSSISVYSVKRDCPPMSILSEFKLAGEPPMLLTSNAEEIQNLLLCESFRATLIY